eukprot:scaffold72209_cov19-Tisochrysis_lutea.AAC.2
MWSYIPSARGNIPERPKRPFVNAKSSSKSLKKRREEQRTTRLSKDVGLSRKCFQTVAPNCHFARDDASKHIPAPGHIFLWKVSLAFVSSSTGVGVKNLLLGHLPIHLTLSYVPQVLLLLVESAGRLNQAQAQMEYRKALKEQAQT